MAVHLFLTLALNAQTALLFWVPGGHAFGKSILLLLRIKPLLLGHIAWMSVSVRNYKMEIFFKLNPPKVFCHFISLIC